MKRKTTHPTMKLLMRNGAEGPKHDPYGWSECIVIMKDGTDVTIRCGALGYTRLVVDHAEVSESYDRGEKEQAEFQRLTGLSVKQFLRAYDRIHRDDIEDPFGSPSRYE